MITDLVKPSVLLFMLAVGLFSLSCEDGGDPATAPDTVDKTFSIGGLLSLSGGNWNTLGIASNAAMEIARDEINSYYASVNSGVAVTLTVVDTRLDTGLAVSKAGELIAAGVRAMIGPQSSAELRAVRNSVALGNVLIVSQGSTASSLSIAGDNVFRFCPDDRLEGAATAALMSADSVRAIVPMCRADAGNLGLFQSTTAALVARGGTHSAGVEYATGTADYASVVQAARTQAEQLISAYGASRTGVYLAAFDEAVSILKLAANDPVLSTLKWYGGDGTVLSTTLVEDADAAAFAASVAFPCPTYGLDEAAGDRWKPIAGEIKLRTGIEPDAFALAAYDAVWVLALAYQSTGGSDDIAMLRSAFLKAADQYYGATGWTALNDAGDRESGNFDFWCVRNTAGGYTWTKSAAYNSLAGTITRY